MPSENFDNKVKQAAEQHHPNYDEMAWVKMEKLLDRHLPQPGDRRRRFIFFFLILLLLAGGAWLVLERPWQKSQSTATVDKKVTAPANNNSSASDGGSPSQGQTTAGSSSAETIPGQTNAATATGSEQQTDQSATKAADNQESMRSKGDDDQLAVEITASKGKKAKSGINPDLYTSQSSEELDIKVTKRDARRRRVNRSPKKNSNKTDNRMEVRFTGTGTIPSTKGDTTSSASSMTKTKDPNPDIKTEDDKEDVADKKTAPLKDTIAKTETAKKESPAKPQPGRKKNNLFIFVAGGPDISAVGADNPGKIVFVKGAGIGYSFGKRWTVRAGFFTANKVYTAKKEDYKPSVAIMNYPYLTKIDATCRVYEIPLLVTYRFGNTDRHSFFAGTGLSSYIMKKEDYLYVYEYPGSPTPYYYSWTIDNKNKHYFSVLNLTGGYQRKINRTFSIAAEPYLKVPLTGIGFGKVRLNSAGIAVSLSANLFGGAKK